MLCRVYTLSIRIQRFKSLGIKYIHHSIYDWNLISKGPNQKINNSVLMLMLMFLMMMPEMVCLCVPRSCPYNFQKRRRQRNQTNLESSPHAIAMEYWQWTQLKSKSISGAETKHIWNWPLVKGIVIANATKSKQAWLQS